MPVWHSWRSSVRAAGDPRRRPFCLDAYLSIRPRRVDLIARGDLSGSAVTVLEGVLCRLADMRMPTVVDVSGVANMSVPARRVLARASVVQGDVALERAS
jgi:hypothetical protein